MEETKRINVNMSVETYKELEMIAAHQGQNITETIRRAIKTLVWLERQEFMKRQILVKDGDTVCEVVFIH